jgi:hypothetical protein
VNLGDLGVWVGPVFILLFFGAMLAYLVIGRRRKQDRLRDIPAFTRLGQAIRLAVEDGTRVHLTLGRGDVTGPQSAAAFVGLSMLRRIAGITSVSDNPPIATSGDGALAILTQDTLRSAYQSVGASDQYDPTSARITGLTPFSYAAGTLPIISDEMASSNVLTGHFGNEVALIADASELEGSFSLGGTDNVSGQAILYATTKEPLIGEELFAGGAYMQAGPLHTASLHAQDGVRILIVLALIGGAILKLLGFI